MGAVTAEGSMFFATGLDNSGLLKGKVEAEGIIQSMAKNISGVNPFAALAVGAVSAFAIIASTAYKTAKDFEHAMKEVETISSATQKNFKGMSTEVFNLSKITPDNPEKLAKAFYQIVSAGYDGAAGLKLLEISAKAAVGGVTDTETAADGLTTVLNAFKISAEESEKVADIMFTTVRLGKTTFSELASNMSTVAPIAAASGVSFEQVSAAIATLTKQGVPTAQAMTQIRAAIIGANKELGDGWSKTMSLQEAFGTLNDKAGGSQVKLQEMVGTVEAVGAIFGVAGNNAKMAAEDLKGISESAGAVSKAYNTLAGDVENQWTILHNRITAATIGIGNAVLEMSGGIVKGLNSMFDDAGDLAVEQIGKEIVELQVLESVVKDVNTSNEDRVTLIKELQEKYPDLLKNIDAETVNNTDLTESIRLLNDQLINKIILQKKDNEIASQAENTAEAFLSKINQERKVREQLGALAKEHGLTLKDNVGLVEQSRDVLEKLGEQKGGRLINPVVEFSHQLSILQLLQKSLNFENKKGNTLQAEKIQLQKELGIEIKKAPVDNKNKAVFDSISAAKSLEDLKQYLNSENAEIKKAAEARAAVLNKKTPAKDKTFEEVLTAKKKQYDSYNLAIEMKDLELAKKLKEAYGIKEADYVEYLRNLYKQTTDYNKQATILESLSKDGSGLNDMKKVEGIKTKLMPISIIPELDTTSINAINAKLTKLNADYAAAMNDVDREAISKKIKTEEAKLKAIEKTAEGTIKLEEDFYKIIQSLSRKGLIDKKRELKQQLKDVKENLGEQSKEYKALQDQIAKINETTGQGVADVANQFSSAFNDIGDLFSKFGDEDTAKLLGQLSGVASGVGKIASGDIVGGSLEILSSAITVEIKSDTEKFEKEIERISIVLNKLSRDIVDAFGIDKITKRLEALKEESKLLENNKRALQAELDARKQVKVLGMTVANKGAGSGTDPEKIKAFEDSIDELAHKLKNLQIEIYETLTNATRDSITDSIIEGFKNGKSSIADFAGTFEEMMRNAIIETLKLKYLETATNKFFEQFGQMAESDQQLTPGEIANLRTSFNSLIANSATEMEALNQILSDAGIAGGMFGTQAPAAGLSGAIQRTITEETGNELAGMMRRIADDVRAGLNNGKAALENLIKIERNTFDTVSELKLAVVELKLGVVELKVISDNTTKSYLNDLGS